MRAIAAAGESASFAPDWRKEYPASEIIHWMHSGRRYREDKKVKDRR
jgi:hypothetical protein